MKNLVPMYGTVEEIGHLMEIPGLGLLFCLRGACQDVESLQHSQI
jgi:hypothetical protein